MILNEKQLLDRLNQLKAKRGTWETHWQELADYCLPRKNEITVSRTPGEKRNIAKLFDSTAIQSAELLAGALHGMLTNPASLWFELTTGKEEIDNLDDVRIWLQKTSRDIMNVLNNSNFQTEIHEVYMDLVVFGTSTMFIEEDDVNVVRFSSRYIKETFICENNVGLIDEVFREFQFSAKNIVSEFGEGAGGKIVADAMKSQPDREFTIVHAVYPIKAYEGDKVPSNLERFSFISQWVLVESGEMIHQSGFKEMPFVVSRWTKGSGEIYGSSPAMKALPDVKMINKMDETVLKGAQKAVDPPLQMTDDGQALPLDTTPGGVNYTRPGSEPIRPIFNDTRIDFGFQVLSERRTRIREAFFIDQLQLNQGPQMTATEVLQRTEEKMRLLGPMLGRQQFELLRPTIDRIFAVMERRRLLSPLPKSLIDLEIDKLDVQYSSTIARAQRTADAQNITRAIQLAAPFIQADPTVLDNINGDEAIRVIARIFGLPQNIIRNADQIDAMRNQRMQAQAQAQERQQFQEDASSAAELAKVMPIAG